MSNIKEIIENILKQENYKKLYNYYQMNHPFFKFSNIISKTKLDLLNKNEQIIFLKNNNIYIESDKSYNINPNVIYSILLEFFIITITTLENTKELIEIKNNLEICFNNNQKEKIIIKYYKRHFKKLNKIDLYYWYNLENLDFTEYIAKDITKEMVINHVSSVGGVGYPRITLFKEWKKIEYHLHILNFLQDCREKLKIHTPSTTPTQKPPSKLKEVELIHSNHSVYKYEGVSEKLFYHILIGMGVINSNKKLTGEPIKPVLSAIYEVEKSHIKNRYLFKGRIMSKPKEFAKWSTDLLQIKINNQYKLSDGNIYVNAVSKEYSTFLSNLNLPIHKTNNI